MLCEPSSSIKIKEDNIHLTTTASHDCNFYKNEMEKLSIYIIAILKQIINFIYSDVKLGMALLEKLIYLYTWQVVA